MNKTIILPIVALITLGITALTGVEINSDLQDSIATGVTILVSAGISLYGIIKNHKKVDDK